MYFLCLNSLGDCITYVTGNANFLLYCADCIFSDDCSVFESNYSFNKKLSSFRYIPVLMQQAKIYWDLENYPQVEKIFRKSVEFCNEHDVWKLNVAHVLFMQESKFKEATGFYEPIVKKHYDNVSDIWSNISGKSFRLVKPVQIIFSPGFTFTLS